MGKIIEDIMRKARGSIPFTHTYNTNTTINPHVSCSTYFQKSSQSERTITQYKEYSGVDTKIDTKNEMKYPYDKVINFVSNFQSGFRGYFYCVKEDHYCRSDCL